MESRCRTVESAASGTESIVNALFALQGIKQVLTSRTGSQDFLGAWRIIEARQMVKTSLSLVPMPTDEDIMEAETPEEDENDEDEDENCSQITISIIDFVLFIAQSIRQSPDRIRSFEEMFTLDPPTMQLICKRLDEDSADKRFANFRFLHMSCTKSCYHALNTIQLACLPRIVLRILDLLSVSFAYPQNISNFLESSGVDLLDLVAKMHKKDEIVQKQISYLMTCISWVFHSNPLNIYVSMYAFNKHMRHTIDANQFQRIKKASVDIIYYL